MGEFLQFCIDAVVKIKEAGNAPFDDFKQYMDWKSLLDTHTFFDRQIIAPGISEKIPILSDDQIFDSYPVQRLW